MDKNRLCYILRSNYPEMLGIRKYLQTKKVQRLYRHILSKKEIAEGENDPSKKKKIITPYMKKWKKYLAPTIVEMNDIFINAPLYKDKNDKEEIKVDMLFCRLAYGFIPSEYVSFELENKTPQERKAFVSDIDTNVFGYSVNNIRELQKILDKGDCAKHFKTYFKRDFIVIEKDKDWVLFHEFVKKHPIFVEKRVFSSMGKGTRLVDINSVNITEKDYFRQLIESGKYLLEERVVQSNVMARFNKSSVNTIRCITFTTNNGVEVPYCFMRAGRNGSFVDNGGSGGLLIGVDPHDGTVFSDGYDEYKSKYIAHPDTGIKFKGCKIPEWNNLINLCKSAAEQEKEIGYLSWDLAHTDSGWVVIEVNEVGQFIGPQIVMRKGIKEELTEYMKYMNKVI